MKDRIIDEVQKFMEEVNTTEMNSNEFVYRFYDYQYSAVFISEIVNLPSIESVTRCRRLIVAGENKYKRAMESRDTEETYQDYFFSPTPQMEIYQQEGNKITKIEEKDFNKNLTTYKQCTIMKPI